MDLRFTNEFVEGLVHDSSNLDIDILKEKKGDRSLQFDIKTLKKDMAEYDNFKVKFIELLQRLENFIFE
jgi:hypothetical protein